MFFMTKHEHLTSSPEGSVNMQKEYRDADVKRLRRGTKDKLRLLFCSIHVRKRMENTNLQLSRRAV